MIVSNIIVKDENTNGRIIMHWILSFFGVMPPMKHGCTDGVLAVARVFVNCVGEGETPSVHPTHRLSIGSVQKG